MDQKIIIDEEGFAFVERTERLPLLDTQKLFNSLTSDLISVLPGITPDSWVAYHDENFTFFRIISNLKLNTVWTSAEDDSGKKVVSYLTPSFNEGGSEMRLPVSTLAWEVPPDMALLFIAPKISAPAKLPTVGTTDLIKPANEHNTRMGLIAVDRKNGDLYRLPLPNVYEDGTLCTGRLFFDQNYPLCAGEGIFGSWEENNWNSDLIGSSQHKYRRLIRLDPKTHKTLPVKENWRALCFRISPAAWISEKILNAGIQHLIK